MTKSTGEISLTDGPLGEGFSAKVCVWCKANSQVKVIDNLSLEQKVQCGHELGSLVAEEYLIERKVGQGAGSAESFDLDKLFSITLNKLEEERRAECEIVRFSLMEGISQDKNKLLKIDNRILEVTLNTEADFDFQVFAQFGKGGVRVTKNIKLKVQSIKVETANNQPPRMIAGLPKQVSFLIKYDEKGQLETNKVLTYSSPKIVDPEND